MKRKIVKVARTSVMVMVTTLLILQIMIGCISNPATEIEEEDPTVMPTSLDFSLDSAKEDEPTTGPEPTDSEPTPISPMPDHPNNKDNIFILKLPTPFENPMIALTSKDNELRVLKPDGSDVVRLTFEAGEWGYDLHPTWGPDRQHIAFVSSRNPVSAVEGSTITQLTFDGARNPAWSPDGTKIAFDFENDIYLIKPDGTGLTHLKHVQGAEPTWAPDSNILGFTYSNVFCFASIDGSQMECPDFDASQSACPGGDVIDPAWSPNGDLIAFHSHPDCARSASLSIYTVNLDSLILSDPNGLIYASPAWSPDGNYIVFNSYMDKVSIMAFEDDRNVNDRFIQDFPGSGPAWSP